MAVHMLISQAHRDYASKRLEEGLKLNPGESKIIEGQSPGWYFKLLYCMNKQMEQDPDKYKSLDVYEGKRKKIMTGPTEHEHVYTTIIRRREI